jgi:hypothetical protein
LRGHVRVSPHFPACPRKRGHGTRQAATTWPSESKGGALSEGQWDQQYSATFGSGVCTTFNGVCYRRSMVKTSDIADGQAVDASQF